ncbi:MAG: hypothetical protein COA73_16810 [Candidatus Hydrogenedentota bacterium]|nr:MAG: hypothetical protein COA73_16810 [Candidatus Hydrogenedentota bacterium]
MSNVTRVYGNISKVSFIIVIALLSVVGNLETVLAKDSGSASQMGARIGMSDSPKYINDLLQSGAENWQLPQKNAYLIGDTISILFLVDNFQRDDEGRVNVTSAFEFLKPDGSTMFSEQKYSACTGKPPKTSTWGIFDPALDLGFDDTDTPGAHLFQLTLTDHVSGEKAIAQVPLMLVTSEKRKNLLNSGIDKPEVLDALWADYLQHKDDLAIRRMVSILHWEKSGSGMNIVLGAAARWSLTSQAHQNPLVLQVCEKLTAIENGTTLDILTKIIEDAKKSDPSEIH